MFHILSDGEIDEEVLPSLKGDAKFDFTTIYDKSKSIYFIAGCHKDWQGRAVAVKECQRFDINNQKFE